MSEDGADTGPSKAEARRARAEQQLVDAAKVREEIAAAKVAEQAKTSRLRALRLAKETADREAAVSAPKKRPSKKAVAPSG